MELAQHSKDINDHLERLWHQKGLRFTLIRGDGVVLLDGAVKEHKDMDNHLSRPEIQDALVNGRGVAVRHSNMMNDTMIYVAEPVKTQWGTLYLRLGSLPGIIPHNNITFIILAIVAVTSVILIKLC